MKQERKDQLNRKLHQIYNNGSGRTEGIIENLIQQSFLGHTYYIHEIQATVKNPPFEDFDQENKDYTLIEVGLYQEGNACIETFTVPVSTKILQDIAARIDMAYYQWMQREPQTLKRVDPYHYYSWLILATMYPTNKLSKQDFSSKNAIEISDILTHAELDAFLPPRNTGEDMEER